MHICVCIYKSKSLGSTLITMEMEIICLSIQHTAKWGKVSHILLNVGFFGMEKWVSEYWGGSDLFLCLPVQTERRLDGAYSYNCENLRAGFMAWAASPGISTAPGAHFSSVLGPWALPELCMCYFCACPWCLLLLTWAVIFLTLTLSLWSCSSVTDLPLTVVILTGAKLHIEFWACPGAGPVTRSLSHDLGSQVALPVLPWPAQSCLQAKFQDHSYNSLVIFMNSLDILLFSLRLESMKY